MCQVTLLLISDGVVNVFREIALISRYCGLGYKDVHDTLLLHSIERERVHYLVQTFGHNVKQVLDYCCIDLLKIYILLKKKEYVINKNKNLLPPTDPGV